MHGKYKQKDSSLYKQRHKDAIPYIREAKHKNDYLKEYRS